MSFTNPFQPIRSQNLNPFLTDDPNSVYVLIEVNHQDSTSLNKNSVTVIGVYRNRTLAEANLTPKRIIKGPVQVTGGLPILTYPEPPIRPSPMIFENPVIPRTFGLDKYSIDDNDIEKF